MTIKRRLKCEGCVHHAEYDALFMGCYAPVPYYIPEEQKDRWMDLFHKKMTKCSHYITLDSFEMEMFRNVR
jgi:hypothetical protein